MNAAARMIHQTTLFNGQLADMQMSKTMILIIGLLLSVLITGLCVTYTTNAYRLTFSQVQQADQHRHALDMQWGQLLLEQASLATSARVAQLANEKLGMQLPDSKNTFTLRAQ
jgi:cell division protein FtsL